MMQSRILINTPMDHKKHNGFMSVALKIAKKGNEDTKPNPKVGAVVVKNGEIVGSGHHIKAGEDHAEVIAIKNSGKNAVGATLYVTLEPCSHFAKTPPCVEYIVNSGIKEVVIGSMDINPDVNGKGIDYLKAHNIKIVNNILSDQSQALNIGFFSRMSRGIPYVRSKIASSIDGRTSLKNDESKWITSDFSRNDVQQHRKEACAILTGVGTINKDNPMLNVRSNDEVSQPYRVILDTHLSINIESNILQQKKIIIVFNDDPNNQFKKLNEMGVQLFKLPLFNGFIDLNLLMQKLSELEFNDILVESGPTLNGQLLEQNLIDELILYIAPILMGGEASSMFNDPVLYSMKNKIRLEQKDIRYFGKDIRLIMKVIKH